VYFVVRSNLIDAGERDDRPIANYQFILSAIHTILAMHTIAAAGNTLVCGLKESIGAGIIAGLSLLASIAFHIYVRMHMSKWIFPTPETIAELEAEAAYRDVPLEAVRDSTPFVPDYTMYRIDRSAERDIKMSRYDVNKDWVTTSSPQAVGPAVNHDAKSG
jgi:hypothetical protein